MKNNYFTNLLLSSDSRVCCPPQGSAHPVRRAAVTLASRHSYHPASVGLPPPVTTRRKTLPSPASHPPPTSPASRSLHPLPVRLDGVVFWLHQHLYLLFTLLQGYTKIEGVYKGQVYEGQMAPHKAASKDMFLTRFPSHP